MKNVNVGPTTSVSSFSWTKTFFLYLCGIQNDGFKISLWGQVQRCLARDFSSHRSEQFEQTIKVADVIPSLPSAYQWRYIRHQCWKRSENSHFIRPLFDIFKRIQRNNLSSCVQLVKLSQNIHTTWIDSGICHQPPKRTWGYI